MEVVSDRSQMAYMVGLAIGAKPTYFKADG
jgi:hypothetical protein